MGQKNMKEITVHMSFYDLEGPVEEAINYLRGMTDGIEQPELRVDYGSDLYLTGYRPMTDKEIERAERRRQLAKEAAVKKKAAALEKDRREYERLKKKFEKE